MLKEFEITLDTMRHVENPVFIVNTNDKRTIKLRMTVTKQNNPVDLTGLSARIAIQKPMPEKKTVFQECEIVDAENGKIEVVLDTQSNIEPGKHYAELMLYGEDGLVAVTTRFAYESKLGIMNDETVESSDEWQAIHIKIEEAQAVANEAQSILNDLRENGTGIDAQARAELITHKAESTQNAHLAKNIGIEDTAGNFTATDVEGALSELFQSVSDGKTLIAGAITDKGVPTSPSDTFQQMTDNIREIPVGDYAVGDTIKDSVLRSLPGGMGVEIWSNTDMEYGQGVAVDSAGNVYVTHNVGSGQKAIRKLDPNGNEIWAKTDVANGWGIAVDSVGNVYVTHNISSGQKSVRKLDPNGNEIWSKTDVGVGRGITVDSAGNVYVAHGVGSGKTVRKLDPNGNEIWSKTDVPSGSGIAIDSVGNVYVTHNVGSGEKSVRKLDQNGNEIWSNTDVANGMDIAVDIAGNVYVVHNVGSGKAVRKLDMNGNEIWSKTDVANGWGIAVDAAGNVYVAHNVGSGKAIRKLDQNGNEIWSKMDVGFARDITVNAAGNVYVVHNVSNGEKVVRKLDGNLYFQIVG